MRIDPLYILPNLFTGASIYLGVLSIAFAFHEKFELACWLILASLIFDGLDGRVARLTGTASKFGIEFDSLADIVAFGVAPAMILFCYTGLHYGKLGIMVSGLYVVFGAIRLARFNITTNHQSNANVFLGLPIPSAAIFIVSWILLTLQLSNHDFTHYILNTLLIATFFIALLMVSNIRYPNFKKLNFEKFSFTKIIILLMIILAILFLYPIYTIVTLISFYVLFGPCRAFYYLVKKNFK